MNKVILLGRLARDPEVRYSQAAEPLCVARYTVAVNRRFKRDGEQAADFISCVSFGKTGEFVERFFKKGMAISLSGRIQVRDYTDKNGQRQWSTEVVTEEVDFAESRTAYESRMQGGGGSSSYDNTPQPPSFEPDNFSAITKSIDDDDDLPF